MSLLQMLVMYRGKVYMMVSDSLQMSSRKNHNTSFVGSQDYRASRHDRWLTRAITDTLSELGGIQSGRKRVFYLLFGEVEDSYRRLSLVPFGESEDRFVLRRQ
jgi:hypothetical protein